MITKEMREVLPELPVSGGVAYPEDKDLLLGKAIQTAEELISRAEEVVPAGLATPAYDPNARISIAAGTCGHVLFLLQLWGATGNEKYLLVTQSYLEDVVRYCKENPSGNYGFYNGRMGVAFTLLKAYQATGKAGYLHEALVIAKGCNGTYLSSPYTNHSLAEGRAGTALVLLQLHASSGEGWLLEYLDAFVQHLTGGFCHGPAGVYWSRGQQDIKALCDFALGNAGIAYLFAELGHYFRSEAFYYLSAQALTYVNQYWDEKRQNWPDLRKEATSHDTYRLFRERYLHQDAAFFTEPGECFSLAHGSAGIGLGFLRFTELTGRSIAPVDGIAAATRAIGRHLARNANADPSLFGGKAGAALFLLEAWQTTHQTTYGRMAYETARALAGAGQSRPGDPADFSLFRGKAGIGLVCALLGQPAAAPLLVPTCKETPGPSAVPAACKTLAITLDGMREKILLRVFPYTVAVVQQTAAGQYRQHLAQCRPGVLLNEKQAFTVLIRELLNVRKDDMLREAFGLETSRLDLRAAIRSNALQFVEERVYQERLEKIYNQEDHVFMEEALMLAKDIKIVEACRDWTHLGAAHPGNAEDMHRKFREMVAAEPGRYLIVLKPLSGQEVEELPLAEEAHILDLFTRPRIIREVVMELLQLLLDSNPEYIKSIYGDDVVLDNDFLNMLVKKIRKSVSYLLNCGVLKPVGLL